ITLHGGGDVTVTSFSTTGNASVTSDTGKIINAQQGRLSATNHLTLSAGTAVGATGTGNEIDIATSNLTATASNGDLYVDNSTAATLASVVATGGNVSVTNAGNVVVETVKALGNQVTITANTGAITDDGSGQGVQGGTLILTGRDGI